MRPRPTLDATCRDMLEAHRGRSVRSFLRYQRGTELEAAFFDVLYGYALELEHRTVRAVERALEREHVRTVGDVLRGWRPPELAAPDALPFTADEWTEVSAFAVRTRSVNEAARIAVQLAGTVERSRQAGSIDGYAWLCLARFRELAGQSPEDYPELPLRGRPR